MKLILKTILDDHKDQYEFKRNKKSIAISR